MNYNKEDVLDELWKQGIRVPFYTALGNFIECTIDETFDNDLMGGIFYDAEYLAEHMIENHMEQWEKQDGYSDELFNENYKEETA